MNTIIVIDTDIEFTSRFRYKLDVEDLAEFYQVWPIVPQTVLQPEQLVNDCLRELQAMIAKGANVCGVFVDIVIIERRQRRTNELDTTGIEIAGVIRKNFPNIPLLLITGKYLFDVETDIFSRATLEDVDGVLFKDYLEGEEFSARRLKDIFYKANLKRRHYLPEQTMLITAAIPESAKKGYNYDKLDVRVKSQINDIGEGDFWSLLLKLIPDSEGIVSYMQPGRSGAYVFRVDAKIKQKGRSKTRPKSWVLKISNEIESIRREITNYNELTKTPLPRSFYPKTLNPSPVTVGNWAGIAIELEGDAASLLERFNRLSDDTIRTVSSGIAMILNSTYGDPDKRLSILWKDYYELSAPAVASILCFLGDYRDVLSEKCDTALTKRILDFVSSSGVTEPIAHHKNEADQRTIHGDFNSRNLLINENGQVVLIDFSSRRQSHVASDIAKLERDMIFRVFDVASPNYYDWSRLKTWQEFLPLVALDKVFLRDSKRVDPNLDRTIGFVYANRRTLKLLSPDLSSKDYLCALLHYSLLALAHPEISIHKKVFGIKFIGAILDSFY